MAGTRCSTKGLPLTRIIASEVTNKLHRQATRVPEALGAFEWNAASLHPAKLCLAVLAMGRELGLSLFTHTPATGIEPSPSGNKNWVVSTARDSITTPVVVHATNAFADTLLPQLKNLVTPMRAQAHKIIPTPSFSSTNMLTHTYSLRFALHHFYSLIQRKSDGTLVLGTSRGIPGLSETTRAELACKNDRVFNEEIQEDAVRSFKKIFPNFGEEALGEGLEFGWTGILGMVSNIG